MSIVSAAERKSAVAAALQQVRDGRAVITAAGRNSAAAQGSLTAVTTGSGHDAAVTAQAAVELEQSLTAAFTAAEQAESHASTL